MNAASSWWRSLPCTLGPARTTDSAAEPGSELPLCSRYITGPLNLASVTTDPSPARNRDSDTFGAGGFGDGAGGAVVAGAVVAGGVPVAGAE